MEIISCNTDLNLSSFQIISTLESYIYDVSENRAQSKGLPHDFDRDNFAFLALAVPFSQVVSPRFESSSDRFTSAKHAQFREVNLLAKARPAFYVRRI